MPDLTTIVLTGGTASRMRPLSVDADKCMIPFMGRPLLSYLVEGLRRHGITDMIFTSPGRRDEIRDHFREGRAAKLRIRYPVGLCWRGTAGTVADLVAQLGDEVSNPVMVIYGDSLLSVRYIDMAEFHLSRASQLTVLYHEPRFDCFPYEYHDRALPRRGPRTNYGVMDVDALSGKLLAYEEKPLLRDIPRRFRNPVANAAVYIIDRSVWPLVPPEVEFEFVRDPGLFTLAIQQSLRCFAFGVGAGYRLDIGTLRHYYAAHMAALRGTLDFAVPWPPRGDRLWIGRQTSIGSASALVPPVSIGGKSTVGAQVRVECSSLGSRVRIGDGAYIFESVILDGVGIGRHATVSQSIVGPNCTVGDNVKLPPGTVLGADCQVGETRFLMPDREFCGLIRR